MRSEGKPAWAAATVAAVMIAVLLLACRGGASSYRLTVVFNTSVTQVDMDEVDRLLRDFDSSAQMLITETFPPVGHVTLKTSAPDLCSKIKAELERLSFVQSVTCESVDGGSAGDG